MAQQRNYKIRNFICGDAKDVLTRVLEQLQGTSKVDADYDAAVVAAKQAAIDALRKQIDQYALICDHLRAALPQDGIFVRDITMSGSTWGSRLFLYKHQTKTSTRLRVQLVCTCNSNWCFSC